MLVMLTSGFDRLPQTAKVVHAVALCLIGMNVIIMMTPAALHRLSFGGEDSPRFFRLGSALVTVGPAFPATRCFPRTVVIQVRIRRTDLLGWLLERPSASIRRRDVTMAMLRM